jgi:hypothetical protein
VLLLVLVYALNACTGAATASTGAPALYSSASTDVTGAAATASARPLWPQLTEPAGKAQFTISIAPHILRLLFLATCLLIVSA